MKLACIFGHRMTITHSVSVNEAAALKYFTCDDWLVLRACTRCGHKQAERVDMYRRHAVDPTWLALHIEHMRAKNFSDAKAKSA